MPYYSFEYFPPRTEDGVKNLYERLDRMAKQGEHSQRYAITSSLGPPWAACARLADRVTRMQ